jgi:benzoate/toluate 1,2-dioxygenase beta subunit
MSSDTPSLQSFEQFIFSEVRCIDERQWDKWLDLFDEDGDYWIPLSPEDENPYENLSIAYEDRSKLSLRCKRYAHPQHHAQSPPSRTCHIVSNVMLDAADNNTGEYNIYAQFTMREYRLEHRVDWAGTFHYRLRIDGETFKIKRKKVLLIDSEAELETMHVPI